MLGYLPAIIFQCMGVGVPIVGIIVLLKKGQGKTNVLLVMANFGALLMNWGYLQFLQAVSYPAAVSVHKFEYIGGMIFYLFFVLFLKSYFLKDKRPIIYIIGIVFFVVIEGSALFAVMLNSHYAYEGVTVHFRADDGKFYTHSSQELGGENPFLNIIADPDLEDDITLYPGNNQAENAPNISAMRGYAAISVQHGTFLQIRYSYLAFILFIAIVASCVAVIKRKVVEERKKLLYLTGAEIVVYLSLMMSIFASGTFNFAPLLVSLSVLSIICGTANGNFFTVADMGRGWVLDHSDVIFVIVDTQKHILDANEAAQKTFPEISGLATYAYLPENLREDFFGKEENLERNGRIYAKRVEPLESKGKVIGYSILFMDMTNHYELMDQLEKETQKAIAANDAKSNFMSNMSHEIRTPMNAIVGMTEIMLRHDQSDFNLEYLNNIKSSGTALLSVINDILDFSKIESGKLEIIPDEYEIMSVLNDLSMIFLNRIGEKPIELIYDIDPKLPARLFGDAGRIRQVLLNIVNNAIKYTDEGIVKLGIETEVVSSDEIMLKCAVWDSGIGIKEENIPKLFSSYSQIDTKKNRGKEGTGLGLSIAKQLVEAMGGSIRVESVYGEGSCFSFTMKQKVMDKSYAAHIKDTKQVYVTGNMRCEANIEMLKKLCGYYEQITFVEYEDVLKHSAEKLDYIFFDRDCYCESNLTDEEQAMIKEYNAEAVILHNPMMDTCDDHGVTVMNKPLYTLNFCLALNHEVLEFQKRHEKILAFTAPTARALIVDDNEMNRKVAAGLLEPIKMTLDMATNGRQAVDMVCANQYDIVFMDHMMPIMDGIEATEAIRAMSGDYFANLKIIALSANALAEAKEQFVKAGMDDFLAKPIKTKELVSIVYKYLPSEKVVRSDEAFEEAAVNEEELPVIKGLNVTAGIENSGGLKLFMSLLGDFYKLIDRKATKIEKCLADDMIRDYTIEVHALKNTSRMIGALKLADMFYELEKAGNALDMDIILNKTKPTLDLYRSYKPILELYAVDDNLEKEEISGDELRATITELKDAMDGFDLDGADAAMKKLENSKVPEDIRTQIEDLAALVADVAMEEVVQLCDRLLEEIS